MNATTSVPTRKATAKITPSTSDKAASPIENEAATSNPLTEVAAVAITLLNRANAEHDSAQGETCSIHAHTLVELGIAALRRVADDELGEVLYEAAALAQGALELDKAECPTMTTRHAAVKEAFDLLEAATISLGFVNGPCEDLALGIKLGRSAVPELNLAQAKLVIETVASRALTLHQMMMVLQGGELDEEFTREVFVSAAVELSCSIGAIADGALGGFLHGDADHWNHGPLFAKAGKAVQA